MARQRAIRGSGTIYKDTNRGRYVGQAVVDGKRRKVYAATKTEARQKLNALMRGEIATTDRPMSGRRPGDGRELCKVLDEWLLRDVAGRDLAPSTAARHRWAADHLKTQLGGIAVNRLTVDKIEDTLGRLVDGGLSQASTTKVLQTLKQALRYANRRGEVDRNAAADALVPANAARRVPRRALSPSEARSLLSALDAERNGAMFTLMLTLGLRPGEAMGLHWVDIDLDGGTVNVTRGVQLDHGRAVVIDELKTSSAKRTLALHPVTTATLEHHRKTQLAERLAAASWAEERLVFASPTGSVLSPPNVRRQLAAVCERLDAELRKVDPDSTGYPTVRPNELRHSCASYLIDEGVGIEVVADVLGHTSTRMVDATYRHRLRPVVDVTATASWMSEAR